jgi:glycosyltransferase involved in cell wall biosynthesis
VAPLRHRVLNGLAYRASDRVLVNSAAVGRTLTGVEWTPRARVLVVPNFLDDAVFATPPAAEIAALRAGWGVPAGARLVGIVARLRPEKDHATLVRAFARLADARPDVRLALLGDGECEAAVRALAASLGVADRVHFVGHVAAAARAQHALDVSVLSSLNEGFPNAVLEAMAAARPVVATDVGGVRDAITDGETGWLVPPADPAAMAAALARAVDDPAAAGRVGMAGRAVVERRFRAEPVLTSLLATYHALARQGAEGARGGAR